MHDVYKRLLPNEKTAAFSLEENAEKGRPFITVQLLGRNGSFYPVRCMADAGNDLTLISQREGERLGFTSDDGRPFRVAGISGAAQEFRMVDTAIQVVQGAEPLYIKMGIGPVRDNLLGREGIFDQFHVIYSPDHITFVEVKHYAALAATRGRFVR